MVHVHGMRPLVASKQLNVPVVFTNHTSGFLKRIPKGAREMKKVSKRLSHVSHVLAPSIELIEATNKVGYEETPPTFLMVLIQKDLLLMDRTLGMI